MATFRIDGDGRPTLDGLPLGELRRWTVDKRAGDPPVLYVETVADAALEVEGVEVVQNVVGNASGAAIAAWLRSIDPDDLESAVMKDSDFETPVLKSALAVLASWASKA